MEKQRIEEVILDHVLRRIAQHDEDSLLALDRLGLVPLFAHLRKQKSPCRPLGNLPAGQGVCQIDAGPVLVLDQQRRSFRLKQEADLQVGDHERSRQQLKAENALEGGFLQFGSQQGVLSLLLQGGGNVPQHFDQVGPGAAAWIAGLRAGDRIVLPPFSIKYAALEAPYAGERFYCKWHFLTLQGIKNLTAAKADELAGSDPDYATRDLFEAIERKDFPKWRVCVQVMPEAEAETYHIHPFDLTKVWPHKDYPLHDVGIMELNRNPENYFAEIEQAAFSPVNIVPGMGYSPDKMLQARLIS